MPDDRLQGVVRVRPIRAGNENVRVPTPAAATHAVPRAPDVASSTSVDRMIGGCRPARASAPTAAPHPAGRAGPRFACACVDVEGKISGAGTASGSRITQRQAGRLVTARRKGSP